MGKDQEPVINTFYKQIAHQRDQQRFGFGPTEGPKGFDDGSWLETVDFERGTRRVVESIVEQVYGISKIVGVKFYEEVLPELPRKYSDCLSPEVIPSLDPTDY